MSWELSTLKGGDSLDKKGDPAFKVPPQIDQIKYDASHGTKDAHGRLRLTREELDVLEHLALDRFTGVFARWARHVTGLAPPAIKFVSGIVLGDELVINGALAFGTPFPATAADFEAALDDSLVHGTRWDVRSVHIMPLATGEVLARIGDDGQKRTITHATVFLVARDVSWRLGQQVAD